MKIDKINKTILYLLTQNARIFDSDIAKQVNRTKETVGYRINQLEQEQVIKKYITWVDPALLGYTSGKIYLQLANKPELKQAFIQEVTQDKRLFWLGIAEGAWNAGLTYFVKSNKEFFRLKNELFAKYEDLIIESTTAKIVQVQVGPKSVLHNEFEDKFLTLFSQTNNHELDSTEKAILNVLMKHSRTPITQIAQKIHSTVDIVRHRIKTLENNNIIAGYSIGLDHQALGLDFYKTFVYMKNFTKQREQQFDEYCKQDTNITHVVKQISPWDVELEILATNYKEYNQSLKKLTEQFSDCITKTETAIMTHDYVWPAGPSFLE